MLSIIPNRSVVKISGPDRLKFLQNLVTNDLTKMQDSAIGVIYAMMLSPQGRFLFDLFILNFENHYLLDVFSETKDILIKKLSMYKINLEVTIEDMPELYVGYENEKSSEFAFKDPRYLRLGYRTICNTKPENSSLSLYVEDKYQYTIPDGGIDLIQDKAMPQEYGAEELNAISYTKGCYIGQEVISRTKSQGVVRKKIYKINSEFDLGGIIHGTEITLNDKKIGIFCSGYQREGIALIRVEDLAGANNATLAGNIISLNCACWY